MKKIIELLNYLKFKFFAKYTGLRDRNRKKICVGHIVKVVKCGCGKEWCKNFTEIISEVKYNGAFLLPFGDNMQGQTYQDSKNYKIIGNIYQNYNLLEK